MRVELQSLASCTTVYTRVN